MKLFFTLPEKIPFRLCPKLLSAVFIFLLAYTAPAQTVRTAASPSQLNAAIAASSPGDTIIMTNGAWTNVTINFNASASAAHPVVLRAQTPGKVILNGSSSLLFSAPYLIVNGLCFKEGALSSGAIVRFNATNCRLTNTAIINYNPPSSATSYYWVYFNGASNRVDNCYFTGKNHHQPAIGNDHSDSRYNTVDHCYFKDMGGSGNGSEILRIWGYGGNEELGTDGAFFTIEYNLFDAADGEGLEMISLKSNRNIVRYNTIINTKGEITLRSGNYNTVEGNFIFGNNKDGSKGIRLTGQYHKIINNYIENVTGDGIVLYAGEYIDTYLTPDYEPILRAGTPLGRVPAYGPIKNAIIAHNTIVNPGRYGMEIGAGYKVSWPTSQRVLFPENCTIVNNVILKSSGTAIRSPAQDVNPPLDIFNFQPNIYQGNIIYGATLSMNPAPASGIVTQNPLLSLTDGLYRPSGSSPLINAAAGAYVTDDMDGQSRGSNPDIGADEVSNATITRQPLTPQDAGPQWINEIDEATSLDITDNGGIITAQYENTSKPSESYPSVIDNNTDTKYFISGQTALWMQYQSTVPATVVRYTLTSANDVPERDPKDWSLQASNDGTAWVTLDTRTGETFSSRFLTKTYTISNTQPYTYYRLVITANNGSTGIQLAEWELIKAEDPESDNPFDITDNEGTITAQYANTSKPAESYPSLIDNNATTKYFINNRTALWVQYQSTVSAIAVKYTITSANDVPARDPRSWNFQASNDGVSWVTLDTRTDETFESRFLIKTFTFENTTAYLYYRLNITANNGAPGTQFAEWEIYQRKTQTLSFEDITEKTYLDEPFELIASASSKEDVTFQVVSGPAIYDGELLTITGAGTITVKAFQPGDDNYFPIAIEKTFIVKKASQEVTLAPIETKTYNDPPLVLQATNNRHLPVSFEIISGPATVTDSVLTIAGAGIITVRAHQKGNENYLPAFAEQSFTVNKASQVITFPRIRPKREDESVTLSATAGSGLPVHYSIVWGPGIINNNTLSFTGKGIVIIRAGQPGNDNYLAAPNVYNTVLVYANHKKKEDIKIYPNPTQGRLKVRLDNKDRNKQYVLRIYDKNGHRVASAVIQKHDHRSEVSFDLSDKQDGIYYLNVFDGEKTVVKLIIKK